MRTQVRGYFEIIFTFVADNDFHPAKALYRRALAHIYMKDEDKAEPDLMKASQLMPDDAAIAGELAKIRQQRREKREKEKKQFRKMFG